MPRPRYFGDGFSVLPAKNEEPYRLWHAWAIAARRMGMTLHPDYEEWGPFESEPFSQWFDDNWERLFSATTELVRLVPGTEVPNEMYGRGVSVFIPLQGPSASKILTQLEMIIRAHFVHDDDGERPRFSGWNVTYNYERGMAASLPETRRYLRLLNNWIDLKSRGEPEPFDKAVIWTIGQADTYKEIRQGIGGVPNAYRKYASYLSYRAGGGTEIASKYFGGDECWENSAEYYRRPIAEDLRKAKKIAHNVAILKQFPGDYSERNTTDSDYY